MKGTYTNNTYHRTSILLFYIQSIPIVCSYSPTVMHEEYPFGDDLLEMVRHMVTTEII